MKKSNEKKVRGTVVITGGTSGIGAACADVFRKSGYQIISIARNAEPECPDTFYMADVTDESAIKEIFNKIDHIDILINNAGYGLSGATELLSTDEARHIIDVNFIGKFIVSKYALPKMKRGAKIFYVSSSMALHPVPFRALYGASKAAVRNMALAQRMELRDCGIDVCCVCPGDIKTSFTTSRVKNFATNERYGERINRAAGKLDGKEGKRMPPSRVADVIFAQSQKRRTKPQVIIGGKHKVLHFLTSRLPLSWYLRLAEKATGGGSATE